jgi:hypothetical protein
MRVWCVVVRRSVPPGAQRVTRLVGPFETRAEARIWIQDQGLSHVQHHFEVCELETPAEAHTEVEGDSVRRAD